MATLLSMWQDLHDYLKARSREALNGCWLWNLSHGTRGYGQAWYLGKQWAAHRLMLTAKLGRSLEPGECACHTCDVPSCINPAHLFAGTQADNVADCIAKGRNNRADEALIAQLLDLGDLSKAAIARRVGCDVRTVFRAAKRLAAARASAAST